MKDPFGKRGFATISTAIMVGLVLAIGLAMLTYVMSSRRAADQVVGEQTAVEVADAGIQKAIFCLNATSATNCGGTYGADYAGETGVDVGSGTFTTSLTGTGADRDITSVGTSTSGYSQTVKAELTTVPPSDAVTFSYALQAGDGGAYLANNASIQGTLYTGGDVSCQSTQGGTVGDIWISKTGGTIDSCSVGGNAYADNILNSAVAGSAYYSQDPSGISGTTVGGSKYPGSSTPPTEPLPNIDLDFWRNSAQNGGIIYGDYHPTNNESLGPVKIEGNLIMDNNVNVNVTGPIWVVGNITTGNNSSFSLDPSWGSNSTAILADNPGNEATSGYIDITNNTGINGSGDPKSYIMFVSTNSSTSDTVPSISVANNASGAVFYATSGVLRLENNAGAKSLAGYRLYVDQKGVVTYVQSDLSGTNFSNSPGGVWRLLGGTWRQVAQ